ncbi:MAG: MBOAT family protein, partial [Myxococcales bacterium]|nr:MBOAT family protein [Myxococcales bacterium]
MLFNSLEFVTFFVVVFTLYWATVRWAGVATMVLLLASLLFYACWNPLYLLLIIASSGVDFLVGGKLFRVASPRRRKALLIGSLVYNLGVLALFKYFNFFMESLGEGATWLDKVLMSYDLIEAPILHGAKWLTIRLDALLPVGISFFTFQSMSYTIDVYRGVLKARKDPVDFALYVTFFPQLVAGPIVRATTFLEQLDTGYTIRKNDIIVGVTRIVVGFFRKLVLSDNLAPVVNQVFGNPSAYGVVDTWVASFAFGWQIYLDFAGYTDIARGVARLFGYEFEINFLYPMAAKNITDHWSRWHISLTTWIRDYVYIPLGGSRVGPIRTYVNIAIVWLATG